MFGHHKIQTNKTGLECGSDDLSRSRTRILTLSNALKFVSMPSPYLLWGYKFTKHNTGTNELTNLFGKEKFDGHVPSFEVHLGQLHHVLIKIFPRQFWGSVFNTFFRCNNGYILYIFFEFVHILCLPNNNIKIYFFISNQGRIRG